MSRLRVDDLLEQASAETGLDDFGPSTFREGLDVLVSSYEQDAGLNDLGYVSIETQLVRLLANRLEIQDWVTRHPEIADQPVPAPLVIVGLPRTGTTLLSTLLALDPAHRTLMYWESMRPCPPPDPLGWPTDPRVATAHGELEFLYETIPEFRAIHPMESTGPNECVVLLAHEFQSVHFETQAYLPSYAAWNDGHDQRNAYETHRLILQLLQWRFPGERWSLKSPAHLGQLDALAAVYPDAQLVWTHRDPATVLASLVSLNTTLHRVFTDRFDLSAVAGRWVDWMTGVLERGMRFRDSHDGGPSPVFADVHYRDLVADPVRAVRRLYEQLGRELSAVAEARMRAWMEANPPGRHGRHEYSLEQFDLDPAAVVERFASYRDGFDVTSDGR